MKLPPYQHIVSMRLFAVLCTIVLLMPFTGTACGQTPDNPVWTMHLDTGWTFQYAGHQYPAHIPGDIHTDLYRNGLIEDPFFENREQSLQWIERKDWTYHRTLEVSEELLMNKHIDLVMEGLDTYADIYLNDLLILRCDNMFRSWKVDLQPHLVLGANELEVRFSSPVRRNAPKVEHYPYSLPSGNEKGPIQVGAFTRKAAYQFGWDWGPRFVGCGIWRPVRIESWSEYRIVAVHTEVEQLTDTMATVGVEITAMIDSAASGTYLATVQGIQKTTELSGGKHIVSMKYRIPHPRRWCPNGSGAPYMYEIVVRFGALGATSLLEERKKIGLRTVELIRERDSIGTSFYFKVNGKPLFIKGANYIPQDIFPSRVTEQQYRRLLTAVKSSGMNMLRVWGGGIYERDIFYNLCDELGILVWQDFMFANSLYPAEASFVQNIREEVTFQIHRLRDHPSLAIWCGNNEIEVAWKHWGWQKQYGYTTEDADILWRQYRKIFRQMIPRIVRKLDKNRAYVPTSPLSNWGKPENFNHHSMHYWGVWHGKQPIERFRDHTGRFMVEYGYQSFPSMKAIRQFTRDSSRHLGSRVMKNRQKSYIGNDLILRQSSRWLGTPHSFQAFVSNSRTFQALALKRAIMCHRSAFPHCMGTLFWQLNDCWPGPSWSVIDYNGEEKPAMNVIRKYFQPTVACIAQVQDSIFTYLVTDSPNEQSVDAHIQFLDEDGRIVWERRFHKSISTPSSTLLHILDLHTLDSPLDPVKTLIRIKLTEGGEAIFEDTYRLIP